MAAETVDKTVRGEWAKKFDLGNVAIHLHLLPTGKVLYWGRRAQPVDNMKFTSLNEHKTSVYILDLKTLESKRTATNPLNTDELPVNLFCSGHTFQPDGTLLVVGGHVLDGFGEDSTCVYDPFQDTWTAEPLMRAGRWYPTATTLSDGTALVVSGSTQDVQRAVINLVPEIWDSSNSKYVEISSPKEGVFLLYPRLYHAPDGRVFVAGPQKTSSFLDLTANHGFGAWSDGPDRSAGQAEYGASVTYGAGKILYVGGAGGDDKLPLRDTEIIDLNQTSPKWTKTDNIGSGRRHHFATTLPDGTVLVTAGTKGIGFNDMTPGGPVHEPELWDPATGKWTVMMPEDDSRGYHHTALLLPDGRVLSAGSGEYAPDNGKLPNDPQITKISAQIFSPPYLFKGKRPIVSNAPTTISYGQKFTVTVDKDDEIDKEKVSLIRLGSVTHTHNMNQSFQFLNCDVNGTEVTIEGPTNRSLAPAGHYMLFLLSKKGVPAEAPIVLLRPDGTIPLLPPHTRGAISTQSADSKESVGLTLSIRNKRVIQEQDRPPVVVGLTPACPYGLGPCWGGAYEALQNIKDIETVRPEPNQSSSVAFVYLRDDILPDVDTWRKELLEIDNGTYTLRGIEMTLTGLVNNKGSTLTLAGTTTRPDLVLAQFRAESKLEWDNTAKTPQPVTQEEAGAYAKLFQKIVDYPDGLLMQVTGRLQKNEETKKYTLDVKGFVEPSTPS